MNYLDAWVVPVPRAQVEAYRRLARRAGEVWMEHGALAYAEYIAEDVPHGTYTSFPRALELKDDEVVVIACVEFASRSERDAVNARAMEDPRMAGVPAQAPFDGRRMFFGGFEPLVRF